MADPRNIIVYGNEQCRCGHCGYVGDLDNFGGLALPDGMIRCRKCGGVSEAVSGSPVNEEEDLECQAADPID